MVFLVALVVDGALAGTVYALAALAFVIVYKASGVINFALGEWLMLGSRLLLSIGRPQARASSRARSRQASSAS